MVVLTVGLQDFHQKYGPEWDRDARADLVNQIGKKLEQIGRMDDSQKKDVLTRAEWGGFIRWHELATLEGWLISSTHRNTCDDLFSVMVEFEERDSAMNPITLEMNQLRTLVRDLGSDLEQLRKLTRNQLSEVGFGLECAGFVQGFLVQEAFQGNPAASPGNCYMNAIQPTPPPPPSLVGPCLPANNIPSNLDEVESWMDDLFNFGDNKAGQMDRPLHATETLEENAIPAADPIHASTPQRHLGISSPENISTPELDGGASCYPTPSTICAETPRMGEPLTLPGFGATTVSQASDMHGLTSDLGRQSTTPSIANSSTQIVLHLLRSCGISLEDTRIRRILEAEHHILAQDIDGMLRPLFDHWDKYKSLGLHALGLPVQWKGIQAAVDYLRVLDADERAPHLGTVARRIGQVLLYLNYEELCKYPEKYCPPSSKPNVTYVLNCILDAYPDDFRILKSRQCRRDKITGYHVRRGRWWWRLAGNLGVGILLAGDSHLMSTMCNNSFTNSQINVFVTFAQKTRPGTIRIFKALEPVVKSLMFGQITCDLHKVIFDKDAGLLRPEVVACVRANDEGALASQRTENLWQAVDAEKDAAQKMTEFLSFRAGNVTLA